MAAGSLARLVRTLIQLRVGHARFQVLNFLFRGGDARFRGLKLLFQRLFALAQQALLAALLVQLRLRHAGGGGVFQPRFLAALFFQIVVVIAEVFLHAVRAHLDNAVGHAVDEVAVVRDGEDGAVEILQSTLQHFAAVHVQMVGRLVEKEEVVALEHQFAQRNAALFAAGEHGDLLVNVVAGEEEQRQHRAHAVEVEAGEGVPQFVQDVLFRVEPGLVLLVVAQIDVGAELHLARVGLQFAGDDVEQRGLAHAVGADDGHAVAGAQVEVEVFKQPAPLEALGKAMHLEHVVARAAARLEGKAHVLLVHRPFQPFHLFQPLFPALRRADGLFAVVHAIALDDGLLAGDLRLLQLVFAYLPLDVCLPLDGELIVVALVLHKAAHGDLRHAIADAVHEVAVVRDDQHRAAVLFQRVLQPLDGGKVQVVGRLVEHEQVGLGKQQAGKAQSRLFPAG